MSYARMGGDSGVYVFETTGGLKCCYCSLFLDSQLFDTAREMLRHLDEHRLHGDLVPDYTYREIKEDNADLDKKIEND
jgi:hypothetical protein